LSLGRYGADDPRMRKVSLEVTVDRWVSDALGKIRSKKSVSSLVNSLLGTVIRQFDPGPSAPLVCELVALLARHRRQAEAAGDAEALAAISQLHSELEPYIDLAEAEPHPDPDGRKGPQSGGVSLPQGVWNPAFGPPPPARDRRDYYWYAVPVLCHGVPMEYMHAARAWRCNVCGAQIRDT
jgi:hypothetical protein